MKKMVILLLGVMALAVSASATTVRWGLQTGNSLSDVTSGTIYLVYGTAPSADTWKKDSFSVSDITGQQVASGAVSEGFYYDSTGVVIEPKDIGQTGAGHRSFYAIAISADGKTVAVSSQKSARIAAGTMNATFGWEGGNFTTYTAVPEPCAVALLMLGVAAFGLKRRV